MSIKYLNNASFLFLKKFEQGFFACTHLCYSTAFIIEGWKER